MFRFQLGRDFITNANRQRLFNQFSRGLPREGAHLLMLYSYKSRPLTILTQSYLLRLELTCASYIIFYRSNRTKNSIGVPPTTRRIFAKQFRLFWDTVFYISYQGCYEYSHPHPQMRTIRIISDICIRIHIRINQCGVLRMQIHFNK